MPVSANSPPSSPRPSVETRILSGSAWMIAMRWSMRALGLVSTVILARLLTPEDFGIVAMALIVFGLLESVTWTGVDLALIREPSATRSHFDSAWTMNVAIGAALAAVLVLVAPLAGAIFDEPRVVAVLQILALKALVDGFENIGTVAFRIDLDFGREFRFGVGKKLISFVVVVACALAFRNYWALVIGNIAGSIAGVLLSYRMHPFRPRLSVTRWRELWRFSGWLLLSRVGYFLNRRSDQFVVGTAAGTASMGSYHIGYEIGTMFSNEFVMPLRRAMFPNYALLTEQPDRFRSAFLDMLGTVAAICFASGFGLAAVAQDFVYVVFGSQWQTAAVLLQWLAIFGVIAGVSAALEILLLVANRPRWSAIEAWVQLLVLIPATVAAADAWGLDGIAGARTVVAGVFLPVMIALVARAGPAGFLDMVAVMLRPLAAAVVMYIAVGLVVGTSDATPFVRLAESVATGAVVYPAVLGLLWLASGRPPGPERHIVNGIRRRLAR